MSAVSQLERPRSDSLTIHPLQPTIGAEIRGIDLASPLSPEVRDQIKSTLLEYKVIFFRNQRIDREQQIAFARQFGPIYAPPYAAAKPIHGAPGLHLIAATKELTDRLAAQKREYWRGFTVTRTGDSFRAGARSFARWTCRRSEATPSGSTPGWPTRDWRTT